MHAWLIPSQPASRWCLSLCHLPFYASFLWATHWGHPKHVPFSDFRGIADCFLHLPLLLVLPHFGNYPEICISSLQCSHFFWPRIAISWWRRYGIELIEAGHDVRLVPESEHPLNICGQSSLRECGGGPKKCRLLSRLHILRVVICPWVKTSCFFPSEIHRLGGRGGGAVWPGGLVMIPSAGLDRTSVSSLFPSLRSGDSWPGPHV